MAIEPERIERAKMVQDKFEKSMQLFLNSEYLVPVPLAVMYDDARIYIFQS